MDKFLSSKIARCDFGFAFDAYRAAGRLFPSPVSALVLSAASDHMRYCIEQIGGMAGEW